MFNHLGLISELVGLSIFLPLLVLIGLFLILVVFILAQYSSLIGNIGKGKVEDLV